MDISVTREAERAVLRHVFHSCFGRAVAGQVIDLDRIDGPANAPHVQSHRAGVFDDAVTGDIKLERTFIVDNHQDRIALACQSCATGGVGQSQIHALIAVGQSVVEDRNGEGLFCFTRGKIQSACLRDILQSGSRCSIAGRIIDGDFVRGNSDAPHCDCGISAVFVGGESGCGKFKRRVVVKDGQHGFVLPAQRRAAGGILQREIYGLIGFH